MPASHALISERHRARELAGSLPAGYDGKQRSYYEWRDGGFVRDGWVCAPRSTRSLG